MNPLEKQEGGDHYKRMAIQPCEYCFKNNIGHMAGDAIAYITRYKFKNGEQDLRKAIHSLELLIEMEYGEANKERAKQELDAIKLGLERVGGIPPEYRA